MGIHNNKMTVVLMFAIASNVVHEFTLPLMD
jgi:hypothetical protein